MAAREQDLFPSLSRFLPLSPLSLSVTSLSLPLPPSLSLSSLPRSRPPSYPPPSPTSLFFSLILFSLLCFSHARSLPSLSFSLSHIFPPPPPPFSLPLLSPLVSCFPHLLISLGPSSSPSSSSAYPFLLSVLSPLSSFFYLSSRLFPLAPWCLSPSSLSLPSSHSSLLLSSNSLLHSSPVEREGKSYSWRRPIFMSL